MLHSFKHRCSWAPLPPIPRTMTLHSCKPLVACSSPLLPGGRPIHRASDRGRRSSQTSPPPMGAPRQHMAKQGIAAFLRGCAQYLYSRSREWTRGASLLSPIKCALALRVWGWTCTFACPHLVSCCGQ